jgi:large subunit ribosomal protein L18
MNKRKVQNQIRNRRAVRARANIEGTAVRPRLSVFRSNRYTYAQLIDDTKGLTVVSASLKDLGPKATGKKSELAGAVGEALAKKAAEKKITEAVFDRGSYKYHGRVKALAEGARKGGLKF